MPLVCACELFGGVVALTDTGLPFERLRGVRLRVSPWGRGKHMARSTAIGTRQRRTAAAQRGSDVSANREQTRVPERPAERDDDLQLVERARAGEREAFQEILSRHRKAILNLAYRLLHDQAEAEEIAQEAFVRAYFGLKKFRGEARFFSWLCQIAINLCWKRERQRERWLPLADREQARSPDVTERIAVSQALSGLSPPLRAAVVLRDIHGMSYQDIANVLDIPVGTVRSRLSKARKSLRKWLSEE